MKAQSHLQLSSDGFLFDHYSGASFTTNGSGARILALLIQGLDRDEILAELEQVYDVDKERLGRDLDTFLARLGSHRLIREGAGS